MASIASIARRFKEQPWEFVESQQILEACGEAGHAWRERLLGPVATVQLMVLQMLLGNVSCRRLIRIAGLRVSVAAYIQARVRLPLAVLRRILEKLNGEALRRTKQVGRWLGHRVILVDGSGLSMPDTKELQKEFGQPGKVKPGCGFPVMHMLWLFDAGTGLLVDYITGRWNCNDLPEAVKAHGKLEAGDVLVGDRAFCSYAHLALLLQRNLHAVVRAHQRLIVSFRYRRRPRWELPKGKRQGAPNSRQIERLGTLDQVVAWRKPNTCPKWMPKEQYDDLPEELVVRELRYRLTRRGFRTRTVTLVTTLLDPDKYPKEELQMLYGRRWEVETNLRHLKETMGMGVLRCKMVDGVTKELLAYAIAYNLVRLRILEAAARQGVPPQRISFIDALDVAAYQHWRDDLVTLAVHSVRPNRDEPRVIKRPKDRYTYLTKPRPKLRQALGITRCAA